MPVSQVQKLGRRYDAVWGSTEPAAWSGVHHGMIVSNYFIMGMDRYSMLHHSLSWWKSSHPDWILYACDAAGHPTHDIAYMKGVNVPDMPLDIHNPSVAAYQIDAMAHAAAAAGYNSLAIDQVLFWNTLIGGNPSFGQHPNSHEYGCGVWHGGTFERRYSSPGDKQWIADVVSYMREAKQVASRESIPLVINHPAGNIDDPDEQQILQSADIEMDETGFSDYGRYAKMGGRLFKRELAYMQYAQEHGVGFMVIDNFNGEASLAPAHVEYAMATYLMGNEGAALLFAGGENSYGSAQYRSEFDAPIGRPCGGPANSGDLYTRAFQGGIAVVNAGSASESLRLPSGKNYRDIEGRRVSSPLSVAPGDAYVLLGPGC